MITDKSVKHWDIDLTAILIIGKDTYNHTNKCQNIKHNFLSKFHAFQILKWQIIQKICL